MRAVTRSADETRALGEAIGRHVVRAGDLIVLAGDLGSGKTVLAQGLARALGVTGPVVSPTFVIMREYDGSPPLVHIDVYRLDHLQELHDLGLEEVLDGTRVALVEWGDVVAALLPSERLHVRLDGGTGEDTRILTFSVHGGAWHARQRALGAAIGPWAAEIGA